MVHPTDQAYQETRRLKLEGRRPASPFGELADWMGEAYGVKVLNARYDVVQPGDRPRLTVIVEWERDLARFREGGVGLPIKAEQARVAERFAELVGPLGRRDIRTDGLFVTFVAFERVARIEANESVTEGELKELQRRLDNPELWTISRIFDAVTFFFYTRAQAKAAELGGMCEAYAAEYLRVAAVHDQLGYLAASGVHVALDSKENFDTTYGGDWYQYYK